MQTRADEYIACDTIFYQGTTSTQRQAMHYNGGQPCRATTGELMWCPGKNNLKPLNVIYNLYIGTEIADVNLKPRFIDYINPVTHAGLTYTWVKNYLDGVKIMPAITPTGESLNSHLPVLSQMSFGQTSDIESHYKKYLHWKQNKKHDSLIMYGVSRGTAATFAALSTHDYPEVKLVILEGAIDSMENVMRNFINHFVGNEQKTNERLEQLKFWVDYLNQHGLFGYSNKGVSPLSLLDKFPKDVPVVFVTSARDIVVSPKNTKNIAGLLAARGQNDVYLLELKNSRHPTYMYDDKEDHDTYESFIHAIYKKYGLQHDATLAQKGEHLLSECRLTKAKERQALVNARL